MSTLVPPGAPATTTGRLPPLARDEHVLVLTYDQRRALTRLLSEVFGLDDVIRPRTTYLGDLAKLRAASVDDLAEVVATWRTDLREVARKVAGL